LIPACVEEEVELALRSIAFLALRQLMSFSESSRLEFSGLLNKTAPDFGAVLKDTIDTDAKRAVHEAFLKDLERAWNQIVEQNEIPRLNWESIFL
jgi:hypothetical protein